MSSDSTEIDAAREAVATARDDVQTLAAERHALQARLETVRRAGTGETDPETLTTEFESVEADLADARERLETARLRLESALAAAVDGAEDAFSALDGDTPVALLPVRLETRYETVERAEGTEERFLLVRVYPDDIHVDTHEERLTADEQVTGTEYWRALRAAAAVEGATDAVRRDRYESMRDRAWRELVDAHGEARAAWIAQALSPANADTLVAGPAPTDALPAELTDADFPAVAERAASWTRPPEARALPDYWVATTFADGAPLEQTAGNPITEPLPVGPSPDPAAAADVPADDPMGESTWLTDFDAAVDAGMGLRIPLADEQVDEGVERLVVIGAKGTLGSEEAAEAMGDLFDAHRFTDGLAVVDQGTPTNNTAGEATGYVERSTGGASPAPGHESTERGDGASVVSDGVELARALGLPSAPDGDSALGGLVGGENTGHGAARAMNTVLWSATVGYYLAHLLTPLGWIDPDAADPADEQTQGVPDSGPLAELLAWYDGYRTQFVDFVRGRGPLPVVRVRNQPYGFLPVVDLDEWEPGTVAAPARPGVSEDLPEHQVVHQGAILEHEVDADDGSVVELYEIDPDAPDETGPFVRELSVADGEVTVDTQSLDGSYVVADPATSGAGNRFDVVTMTPVDADLHARIASLSEHWTTGVDGVPTVNDADLDAAFVEALGMEATGRSYVVRELVSREAALSMVMVYAVISLLLGADVDPDELREDVVSAFEPDAALREALREFGIDWDARVANYRFGGIAGLIGESVHDAVPVTPASADALDAEVNHLLSASLSTLRTETNAGWRDTDPDDPPTLFGALLRHALCHEYLMARVRLAVAHDDADSLAEALDQGVYAPGDETAWDLLEDPVPDALLSHPALAPAAAAGVHPTYAQAFDALRTSDGAVVDVDAEPFAPELVAFLDAAETLSEIEDPDAVEGLFTESLDLAGHRLDAWTTSLATRRLYEIRGGESAADATPGLHLGGYGWVENLPAPGARSVSVESDSAERRYAASADSDGYLQAPSLGQATTAAVLRSGYRNHEGSALGELLAVDLSSARVREAKRLLDGVRSGQSLGALLGYRFERALHEAETDADLEQYIAYFRSLAPLDDGGLTPDAEVSETTDEAVLEDDTGDEGEPAAAGADPGPATVVDGLALYRDWAEAGSLAAVLDSPPTGLLDATADIEVIIEELGAAVDAVRDLSLAEAVHGLVNGTPERAGAAMDAVARGELPPELDLVETPRTGVGLTHRVCVLFGDATTAPPVAPGWSIPDAAVPDAPAGESGPTADDIAPTEVAVRAEAEPYLDAWVGSLLGDPADVVCGATYRWTPPAAVPSTGGDDAPPAEFEHHVELSLSELALSPLDLLYGVGSDETPAAAELETRFAYHLQRTRPIHADAGTDDGRVPADASVELTFDRDPEWPADQLSVAEFLELLRAVRELIAGGRAVDAEDLRPAASAGDSGIDRLPNGDRGDLRHRARATLAPLRRTLADVQTVRGVAADDHSSATDAADGRDGAADCGPTQLDSVAGVVTALTELRDDVGSDALGTLRTTAVDLRSDGDDVATELVAVAVRLTGDVVGFDLDAEGTIPLAAGESSVAGATTAPAGSEVTVTVQLEGPASRSLTETALVGDDGRFEAAVDLGSVSTGTGATVTANLSDLVPRSGTERVEHGSFAVGSSGPAADALPGDGVATANGTVVETRTAETRPADLLSVVTDGLPAAETVLGAARTASEATAVGTTGEPALQDRLAVLDPSAVAAAAALFDATGEWDPDAAAGIAALIRLVDATAPGLAPLDGDLALWSGLADVVDSFDAAPSLARGALEDALRTAAAASDAESNQQLFAGRIGDGLESLGAASAPGLDRLTVALSAGLVPAESAQTDGPAAESAPYAALVEALAATSRRTLKRAASLGVPGSVPRVATGTDRAALRALVEQSGPVVRALAGSADAVVEATAPLVVIENDGPGVRDLTNWGVRTDDGRTYRFPDGTRLDPYASLTLYTGPGTDSDAEYYWPAGPLVDEASGQVAATLVGPDGETAVENGTDVGATPASGAPLVVDEIAADPEGADRATLVDEFVGLRNVTDAPLRMGGWTVGDRANHTYTIPTGFVLGAGATVRVRTGEGTDTDTDLYWNRNAPVWNDSGDTVTVTDVAGTVVVREAWPALPDVERRTSLALVDAHVDARGDDYDSLADEFLAFSNAGTDELHLGGWTVSDRADHVYTFPDGVVLAAGATVRLHTGEGTDTETERFWDHGVPVWNNRGDAVTVRDADGRVALAAAVYRDGMLAAPEPVGRGRLVVHPAPGRAPKPLDPERYVDQIRAVLGEGFTVLPQVVPSNPTELARSYDPSNAGTLLDSTPRAVDTWFERTSVVRDGVGRLHGAYLYAEALAGTPIRELTVGQLPFEADARWVGLPDETPRGGRLSLVGPVVGQPAPDAPVAGLYVDEWTEVVPSDSETTGLALQYDAPNARAPQSVLLAVPPKPGAEWTLDGLRATVDEALELAKLRMVDPPTLPALGHLLPGLYLASNSGAPPDTVTTALGELAGLSEEVE